MSSKRPKIFENIGLKLFALAFAIVLWLLVTNINDPVSRMTISNVQVRLLNTDLITKQGDVYSVLDDSDVVPVVTVTAKRSIIDALDKDDIVATADVNDLSSLDTVEIRFSSYKFNNEIDSIEGSTENVKLSIEKKLTSTFTLKTATAGKLASGYELGSVTPEQNQVRVSGPQSVVSSISEATATVDISGATGSISTYSDIRLLDSSGNPVDTQTLTMNINSVKVNVVVLPVKTIPVQVTTSGSPADGYLATGKITADPETVSIAGKSSVLQTIESLQIPGSAVDISGADSDVTRTVDVSGFLPEGVTFEDSGFDGKVQVTVGIEPAQDADVDVKISSVSLNNVPQGYEAKILAVNDGSKTVTASEDGAFTLRFRGLAANIDGIRLDTLQPGVDIGALTADKQAENLAGNYTAAVAVTLPDSVMQTNTVVAQIRLEKKSSDSSGNE
ncbi:MAG: CdaR family protein [Lachnospiraceae bacterium]|nr:CdaR family protein [Lachnospiraceae bacterium]